MCHWVLRTVSLLELRTSSALLTRRSGSVVIAFSPSTRLAVLIALRMAQDLCSIRFTRRLPLMDQRKLRLNRQPVRQRLHVVPNPRWRPAVGVVVCKPRDPTIRHRSVPDRPYLKLDQPSLQTHLPVLEMSKEKWFLRCHCQRSAKLLGSATGGLGSPASATCSRSSRFPRRAPYVQRARGAREELDCRHMLGDALG
jgi:hypothetical protein